MRPKREKSLTGAKASEKAAKIPDQYTEHQLFLQAFEKPTQIYRFLRTRHAHLPLFLQRTLTYMPKSSTVGLSSRKRRENFKVDTLRDQVIARMRPTYGSLKLQIASVQDYTSIQDRVELNMAVVRSNSSKNGHVSKVFTHSCDIQRNQDGFLGEVVIPEEAFYPYSDPSKQCTFSLLFVMTLTQPHSIKMSGKNSVDSEDLSDSEATDTESSLESSPKRKCLSYTLAGELTIYDEAGACQLAEGDYKIFFRDNLPQNITSTDWVPFSKTKCTKAATEKMPTLKINIVWLGGNCLRKMRYVKEEPSVPVPQERRQTRVYYQFIFHNNSPQITEARGDLRCPWCFVDCRRLYSLLKHLKLCHSRFNFNYTPYRGGARIDVSVNDSFDGSYVGNPQRLVRRTANGSQLPLRRTPITYFMVCRPQRPLTTLSEFLQDYQGDLGILLHNGSRIGTTVGHNRVYYHSHTCIPIKPEEFDNDSESENDPPWLREKTQKMIDEFTDVNEGEKVLMKLWNLHVMRSGTVADCRIPDAVSEFVDKHGTTIMTQRLYGNFLLHLANLLEFGLISSSELYTNARRLQLRSTSADFTKKNFFRKNMQPSLPYTASTSK